jgi:hypothetical protein
MPDHKRAALLRRQIAYVTAVISADEELTPTSKQLMAWRSEIAAQGFADDEAEANDVLRTDAAWLAKSENSPQDLLDELKSELPKAEQLEEEHRIEVARGATGKPSWNVQMALAWIRFRDVEKACRFLGRRDALLSLWRDGLETDELEQRLANGQLVCTGVQGDVRRKISPADWAGEGHTGLRLMRATEPYAARKHREPVYTELRLQRQAIRQAFPGRETETPKDGPVLAAARVFLRRNEDRVIWDELWAHVSSELGVSISKRQKERLEPTLRQEFPHKFRRGAPKRK